MCACAGGFNTNPLTRHLISLIPGRTVSSAQAKAGYANLNAAHLSPAPWCLQVGSFTRPAAAGGAPAAGAIAAAAGATTTSPTSPTPPTLAAPTPLVGARVEQQHTSEGGQGGSREGRGGEGGLRGRGLKRKASPNDNETSPTPDDVSAMIPNPKKEACIKAGTEAGEEAKERDGARVSNRASPRAVRARTSHVADNNTRLPASKLSITVPCTTPIPTHMTPVRASGAGRGGKRSRLAVACFPRSPADRTTPDLVSATLAPLSPSPSPPTAATSNGALAKVPPASHFALPKKGVPAESQPPKQVSLAVCGRRGLETVRERSGEQAKPLGRQRIDKTHVGPGDNMDAVPRGVRTRPGGKRKGGGRGGGEDTAAASPARPAHGRGRSRASAASGSSQPRRGTQKGAKAGVGGAASVPVPTMLTRAQTLRTRLQVRRARAQAKRV